jgi:uncharacterized membrane protein
MMPSLLGFIAYALTSDVPLAAILVLESLGLTVVCFPRRRAWERSLVVASTEGL